MRSYDPSHIECGSNPQTYTDNDKCDHLLQAIPADLAPSITWGPGGQRRLPYAWKLHSECLSYLFPLGVDQHGTAPA